MKVSIIIVSWNVRELLKRCLSSIESNRGALPLETIVIDNGSTDGSSEMIRGTFPSVKFIANDDNRGFAAACNQGVEASAGEYCFFLNPDAEVTADTLQRLARTLDENPQAAIVAPKIFNSDGSIQRSIAKFPAPLSQLLLFLKLDRLFPNAKPLREYRASDFQYDAGAQDVEQPMGAALAVRRSALERVGIFDERFFIWYEEVDLCKRLKDAGYRILYEPRAKVVHSGAQSFRQHDVLRKQVATYTSARLYLEKHFGCRAWYATLPMRIFTAVAGAFLPPFRGRSVDLWSAQGHIVFRAGALIALIEAISYAGYFSDGVRLAGFLLLVFLTLGVSCVRLDYGLAIVFAELIIGSKGYLFSYPSTDSTTLSLRMGLFGAVLLGWLVSLARKQSGGSFFKSRFFPAILFLALLYVYGVGSGLLHNEKSLVFKDANGWLYWLLILPLYDAIRSRERIIRFLSVCAGALLAQTLKVFFILYVMSHKGFGYDIQYSFYRWIRTTGVGEITAMTDHFYRIFLQGHIYALVLFFILLTVVFVHKPRWKSGIWIALAGSIASIFLSFSRSFWIAGLATGVVFLGVLVRGVRGLASLAWGFLLASAAALAVITAVAFFPLPSGDLGIGFDAFANRFKDVDTEAAARSRWELLPALGTAIQAKPIDGYGFGKAVTYTSHDPRVLAVNPSGTYTTYAFEWGYLDVWVKLGIGGLLALLLLLAHILVVGWKAARKGDQEENTFLLGLWFGIIALACVHVFTPYLTHPLGIGILMIAMLCFERLKHTSLSS